MDMTPQRVRTAEFRTVRKGLDPDEVRVFLAEVADELERAQNQSTAMEARARAAVARLQELSETTAAPSAPAAAPEEVAEVPSDQAETISRTLLLAQRTADATVADAQQEAERLVAAANDEAATTLDSTREMAARLLEDAREEARKVGESERLAVESEVNALLARRDFLESDVEHLEQFLVAQRSRLREAANELLELVDRVPGGLGEARRPVLSAADDQLDETMSADAAAVDAEATVDERAADDVAANAGDRGTEAAADDAEVERPGDGSGEAGNGEQPADDTISRAEAEPAADPTPVEAAAEADDPGGFRFRFTDDQP